MDWRKRGERVGGFYELRRKGGRVEEIYGLWGVVRGFYGGWLEGFMGGGWKVYLVGGFSWVGSLVVVS